MVAHRRKMLATLHRESPRDQREGVRLFAAWLHREMRKRQIVAFLAERDEGRVVGSLLLWLRDAEPGVRDPKGVEPFLSTMYVVPAARRRGIATALVREAVGWCLARGHIGLLGIPVGHAPKVLRKLGFHEMAPEMGLELGRRRQY